MILNQVKVFQRVSCLESSLWFFASFSSYDSSMYLCKVQGDLRKERHLSFFFKIILCRITSLCYLRLYMIGYGIGKIILKFLPFCQMKEENQEQEKSKLCQTQQQLRSILFVFSFEFSTLEVSHLKLKKCGSNFKIFFPYPIIYRPYLNIRHTLRFFQFFL